MSSFWALGTRFYPHYGPQTGLKLSFFLSMPPMPPHLILGTLFKKYFKIAYNMQHNNNNMKESQKEQ
jgi:hypothetical protein